MQSQRKNCHTMNLEPAYLLGTMPFWLVNGCFYTMQYYCSWTFLKTICFSFRHNHNHTKRCTHMQGTGLTIKRNSGLMGLGFTPLEWFNHLLFLDDQLLNSSASVLFTLIYLAISVSTYQWVRIETRKWEKIGKSFCYVFMWVPNHILHYLDLSCSLQQTCFTADHTGLSISQTDGESKDTVELIHLLKYTINLTVDHLRCYC